MALFENYERREAKILATLKEYGINSIEECKEITLAKPHPLCAGVCSGPAGRPCLRGGCTQGPWPVPGA